MTNPPPNPDPSFQQLYQSPCLLSIQKCLKAKVRRHVLDLGAFTNSKSQYLSRSQCKIKVLDLFQDAHSELPHLAESEMYDIILCWDIFNYVSPEKLNALLTYLDQSSKKNALLHFFTRNQPLMPHTPCEFQMLFPNELLISTPEGQEIQCPRYSTRFIQEQIPSFQNQRAFLLKNGLQENIWVKSLEPPL